MTTKQPEEYFLNQLSKKMATNYFSNGKLIGDQNQLSLHPNFMCVVWKQIEVLVR